MDGKKKKDAYNRPDSIDVLKDKLYSRSGDARGPKKGELSGNPESDVPSDWDHTTESMPKKKKSLLNIVFWGAVIFFLVALGFALFSLQTGRNTVSPDNIEIQVAGVTEVDAGKVVELEIAVSNRNDVRMESTTLIAEYPLGTRNPDDTTEELRRTHRDIGVIKSGERAETVIEAIFFGTEGETKTITLDVEYRIPDSGATFNKNRTYELEIVSAPLELDIDMPENVRAGEEFEFDIDVTSNADSTLEDVLFVIDYPSGFEFISASPSATFDTRVWLLGDVEAGAERTISVRGRLEGQPDNTRAFRFELGTQSLGNEKVVGTPFVSHTEEVMLRRPLVDFSVSVDGSETRSYTANTSSDVGFEILWRNNTTKSIENVVIDARLNGNAFDPDSLSIDNGQYLPGEQRIVWNTDTLPSLRNVDSGEEGSVSFEFVTISEEDLERSVFDSSMDITVRFDGNADEDVGIVESIEFFVSSQ
ncbi:MAG: hypothetical protein WDZ70_00550 [Candidatus Paceibacterota bacterium]